MTVKSPRQRFIKYMILILAAAALVFAIFRAVNTANDHDRPAPPVATGV